MDTLPATRDFSPADAGEIMEQVLIVGDLSRLTPADRARYYTTLCRSVGLNPLTKPLEYIVLNGKLTLYALKGATDQLRQRHGVSVAILEKKFVGNLFVVHVKAKDRHGREDEDLGVVTLPDNVVGDVRANLILKGITKAKRRVTLSICGLGFLDETEVEDIPAAAKAEPPAEITQQETKPYSALTAMERFEDAVAKEFGPMYRNGQPKARCGPVRAARAAAEMPPEPPAYNDIPEWAERR
jgi:hypothetical protein